MHPPFVPRGASGTTPARKRPDLSTSPFLVFYEVTRACDLVCLHCRACAQARPDPNELTPEASRALITRLGQFPEPPLLILTGGDPLKRADLFDLIRHGVASGLEVAVTPSPTPLVTTVAIRRLKAAGFARLAVSVDGADAATHDAMRGVSGSFAQTRRIMADAFDNGIPVQVNTVLHPGNFDQLESIAATLAKMNILLWSVFFVVPVGRATSELRLSAEQYEAAFSRLWRLSQTMPFVVKTTEAMHYRRYVLQQRKLDPLADEPMLSVRGWKNGFPGLNDGRGIMFISHAGLIHPSGFLPLVCGMFPFNDPIDVYQHSPIFRRLRDADTFAGKCGVCEYRHLCGGSRARAYAVTGDPYAAEPDCVYQPPRWQAAGATV